MSDPASTSRSANRAASDNRTALTALLVTHPSSADSLWSQLLRRACPSWTLVCRRGPTTRVHRFLAPPPALVLVELDGTALPGVEFLRRVKALRPALPVVMLGSRLDPPAIFLSLLSGASGYLTSPLSPGALRTALGRVLRGGTGTVLCRRSRAHALNYLGTAAGGASTILTAREQQVMTCLAENLANKDIAATLGIAQPTLHAHLEHIYRKLHAHTRHQALNTFLEPPNAK